MVSRAGEDKHSHSDDSRHLAAGNHHVQSTLYSGLLFSVHYIIELRVESPNHRHVACTPIASVCVKAMWQITPLVASVTLHKTAI